MAFPEDITSRTPEKMQFKLVSYTDFVICDNPPLEWRSGTFELKRDLDSGGVFMNYQTDSLTFIGNGGKFLRDIYEAYELTSRAKCTLVISYWKEFDLTTPANGRQYVEFPSRWDINFNFYESVKIGRFFFGVRVKAVNNSVQTKLDNRIDVDVDVTKLVSIGGVTIQEFTSIGQLKKVNYPATNVNYRSELNWSQIGHGVLLDRITGTLSYTAMPLAKITSEFTEIQTVAYQTKIIQIANITPFFKNALYTYDSLDIYYSIGVKVTQRHIGSFPWTIQIIETTFDGEIYATTDIGGFGGINQNYSFYGTINISCQKNNSLKLVTRVEGIDNTTAYVEYSTIKITQMVSLSPAATTEGLPIYEVLERVGQHILDTQHPIYSDFFGRQTREYKADGTKYSAENQLRFAHVQGGMNLRGATLDNEDAPLAISFKKLFQSIKALWNVGYSLETNFALFGDNLPRIRIEEYAHFFENTELVFNPPLSSRITKYDIQSQVMPELVPVNLKSGFDNFEYLSLNGRSEPNTTNQRTSPMNTATKYENISPYRADTKGILDNISNPITTTGSTDTKGDNSIFIIKTQKDGTGWKPEANENITIDADSSLFKNALMNRYFTPTRMLIRHANRIKAGMTKLSDSDVLRFQSSDKNCSLQTSGDGLTLLKENDDIAMSTLANPIYKAMKHTIFVSFTRVDMALLIASPFKYLDFGTDLKGNNITGFLLNLKQKNIEDKAEVIIIERYVP